MIDPSPLIPRRFHRLLDAFDCPDWEDITPAAAPAGRLARQRDFRHANSQLLSLCSLGPSELHLTWCATLHRDPDSSVPPAPEDQRLVTVGKALDPGGIGMPVQAFGAMLQRNLSQATQARRQRARHQLLLILHDLVPLAQGTWNISQLGVSGVVEGAMDWIALPDGKVLGDTRVLPESAIAPLAAWGFPRSPQARLGADSDQTPLFISMTDPDRPQVTTFHSFDIDLGTSRHERLELLHRAHTALAA